MDRILKSILAETPRGREYLAAQTKAKRDASARRRYRSPRASAKPDPEESRSERTARVRAAVWARANRFGAVAAACECGCGMLITRETFEMDHWIGAGERERLTTVENCWALTARCHRAKGGPDVDEWNARRRAFCEKRGLLFVPRKPTRYYATSPSTPETKDDHR